MKRQCDDALAQMEQGGLDAPPSHARTVPPPSFRVSAARCGVGLYPVAALGLLALTAQLHPLALLVLAPEMARTLGVGPEVVAGLVTLTVLAYSLAMVPMAAAVEHRPRRAIISVACAVAWSLAAVSTGFVVSAVGLAIVLLLDGAAKGSLAALHPPLLVDTYPAEARVRALSIYEAVVRLGTVVAPLLVVLFDALGFTWRGVFVLLGLASGGATLLALGVRDPGVGSSGRDDADHLGFAEASRQLLRIPTVRRVLAANAVLGSTLIPVITLLFFVLDGRWNLAPGARGIFYAAASASAVAALTVFARRGEELFRADPAAVVRRAAGCLGLGVVMLAAGLASPVLGGVFVLSCAALGLFAVLTPSLNAVLMSVAPPTLRPHAAALAGISYSLVGGMAGLVLLSGIDRRHGIAGAAIAVAVPGLVSALLLHRAAATVATDLDVRLRALAEDEEVEAMAALGITLPRLTCRRLNFAYDDTQVLVGVDLVVDDGEVVALLGANGAGKSTLLRVVAGLELAQSGTVRWLGRDITYVDTQRRLSLGIVPVFGRRGVFASLSVVENLTLFAHTLGRDRAGVRRRVDAALEAFPLLAARRNHIAWSLSGGERQLLAMAKAFILAPRLLLLDEPTLGLSPAAAADVLAGVAQLSAAGTAVVLVEQSPAVALSVAGRATVLDRGRVSFDGTADELHDRPDLLRSVFMARAARAVRG